ncbi:hypothetical protein CYMTET_26512 [Cymbomonas tetramitiformis]|uniref:Uncharacterized protein n=1 Tax=Cymbomonas tetramitiformis TaxID=36881 RepID=A0AAE0KXU5_9CHLO|nr:hypothetical protein CYMTET_26512 [Cymbomonas tetramitiformis]
MGYNGNAGTGLDIRGNFVRGNGDIIKNYGIGNKDALRKWPLTYAAGHPYYTSSEQWGFLRGGNWGDYVQSVTTKIDLTTLSNTAQKSDLESSVLVVENTYRESTRYRISSENVTLLGIVIRKGGVLLLDNIDMHIRVHFIIVESGGLLQAGSHHNDAYRFSKQLTITFEHSYWVDAGNMPITASQYSAEVLHPGIQFDVEPQVKDYMGKMQANNKGVAKGSAVFFNGNYQFNGVVPGDVNYAGTWKAIGRDMSPPTLDAVSTRKAYPMTWARLARTAYAGDKRIVLDVDDCAEEGRGWRQGDLSGLDDNTGVEVATIYRVVNRTTYELRRALRFDHVSIFEKLESHESDDAAEVQMTTHAALLTRNIKFVSDLHDGGGDNVRNGGEGFVVLNNSTSPDIDADVSECMHNLQPIEALDSPKGSWLWGTANLSGCNSIFGAEQKFRYGAAISLDGVEMRKMGTPANFGRLGTYGVHFHLAGYPKSFRGYLVDPAHSRELRVVSSSLWQMFSRWITLHGTMETEIVNNVAFLAYGSGYFLEDGTEMMNELDHNTAIAALNTISHPYWNPVPILGFVSTDSAVMSSFWFKNNLNSMSRNLISNSPFPVMAVWYVPQLTLRLRGPSTLCIGSIDLDLPGFASRNMAMGGELP